MHTSCKGPVLLPLKEQANLRNKAGSRSLLSCADWPQSFSPWGRLAQHEAAIRLSGNKCRDGEFNKARLRIARLL